MVELIIWTFIGFFAGSLPFSIWIGRFGLRKDITQYGDANPGATNVLRAGGKKAGILALLLDILKALIPVGLAYYWAGIDDWRIVPIALAPIVGHAFSPFLGWHGGKAMAASGGAWIALTIWEAPTVGGLLLLFFSRLVGANGWAVLFTFLGMLPVLLLIPPAWHLLGQPPDPAIIVAVWVGNLAIVAYKYRADFAQPPSMRRGTRKQMGA